MGERPKTETPFFNVLLSFDNQVTDHKSRTTKKKKKILGQNLADRNLFSRDGTYLE